LCKKTLVTKHGANFYPQNSLLDKLILNLCDGIIVLNKEVLKRCQFKKNCIKLPPIFYEGVERKKEDKREYFCKENGFFYLLLYASRKAYINNQEVYGVTFVLELLESFPNNIKVILLDPSSEYEFDVKNYETENLIYLNRYVNFKNLVSQVDVYLRPTSSDGNSVATLEALSHGIPVVASDIVERDLGVVCYQTGNKKEFIEQIKHVLQNKKKSNDFKLESISHYIKFCNKVMS
jgi:glycosyltransferase involved in cell wall biosynthesis